MTENQPVTAYQDWHDMLADPRFSPSTAAVRDYLKLCEGLESPTPYHIFSFLSLLAALCGDNIALSHGPMGRERLNLGIVLTGVPAIRKSTALSVMQKFAEGLPVSYGPTDTAGQRQGIMSAMMPRWQKDQDDESPSSLSLTTLEELADYDSDEVLTKLPNPLSRKSSEIYFVSKELGRLIASTSRELFDFFTDGMDGETFHYQLKNQVIKINNPLMNIIGATTPTSLGTMIPRGGDSHGFLSRLIFVHAPTVYQSVAIPKAWGERESIIRERLHGTIHSFLQRGRFELGLSADAESTYRDLYDYIPLTVDVRLKAYAGRRAKHLLKIAALLALCRDSASETVIAADIRASHALLVLTERTMDRAFYGLDMGFYSRVLCAFAELAEGSGTGRVSLSEMQVYCSHLGTQGQILDCIESLSRQGKIKEVQSQKNNDPTFELNEQTYQLASVQLRGNFRSPDGVVKPDEFAPAKRQLRVAQ